MKIENSQIYLSPDDTEENKLADNIEILAEYRDKKLEPDARSKEAVLIPYSVIEAAMTENNWLTLLAFLAMDETGIFDVVIENDNFTRRTVRSYRDKQHRNFDNWLSRKRGQSNGGKKSRKPKPAVSVAIDESTGEITRKTESGEFADLERCKREQLERYPL